MRPENIYDIVDYDSVLKSWNNYVLLLRSSVASGIVNENTIGLLMHEKIVKLKGCEAAKKANCLDYGCLPEVYQYVNEHKEESKSIGRQYSCRWLADFMLSISEVQINSGRIRVIDPCCGAGSLIVPAIAYFNKQSGNSLSIQVMCNDIDEGALEIISFLLAQENKRKKKASMDYRISSQNIIFEGELSSKLGTDYDLCILSPPFINVNEVDVFEKNELNKYNPKITNLAEYFIIKSLDLVKEGGVICFNFPEELYYKNSPLKIFCDNKLYNLRLIVMPIGKEKSIIVGRGNKKAAI